MAPILQRSFRRAKKRRKSRLLELADAVIRQLSAISRRLKPQHSPCGDSRLGCPSLGEARRPAQH
jgi:hypothetical protein